MMKGNETVKLAQQELDRYIFEMTGEKADIELISGESGKDIFHERCEYKVKNGKGIIEANCPRALLLGVYDFLRKCGCRFLRPGRKGEVIPKILLKDINVNGIFEPLNRHRGITIEGAVSLENVLDIIEWAPKVGFNSYFTQFMNSYEFFRRWYEHDSNPFLTKEPLSLETAKEYLKKIVSKIKERSMIYHSVGHGWTSAALGIESKGWEQREDELSQEKKDMLAMINGKREFFKGKPLNTNLCLSNPNVRKLLADKVVEYAENHPETDVLHFWLADDINNVCECEECSKMTFSDWYVKILNEIDYGLTLKNLKTKICFLVYFDLYWAPEKERIQNEDRFILMFAPIFRSYEQSFVSGEGKETKRLEYNKNHMVYPHETAVYLQFLKDWEKIFKGDSFDFDYHMMWDINRDLSGKTVSKVLFSDIRSLSAIGLKGFMSCQIQRAFYPNGFMFYMLGRVLSDDKITYEEIEKEYYGAAFGNETDFAVNLFSELNRYLPFGYFSRSHEIKANLTELQELKDKLEKALAYFPEDEDEVISESLNILRFLTENVLRTVKVMIAKAEKEDEKIICVLDQERKDYFNLSEKRFSTYADGYYVNLIINSIINNLMI